MGVPSVNPAWPDPGSSQRGQGLVEYAFILGLAAVVVVAMLVSTGQMVLSLFSNITSTLHQAGL